MDVDGRMWVYGITMFILIGVSMFFSSSEVAITSISMSRVKKMVYEGKENSKSLLKYKERQSEFVAYSSMSSTFCIVVASILGMFLSTQQIFEWLHYPVAWVTRNRVDMVVLDEVGLTIAIIIAVLISAFFCILLGNTLPKKLVAKNREEFALNAVKTLPIFSVVFVPLTFLPIKIANLISRIFSVDPHLDIVSITEDEIRMMVDASNECGNIELSEREMINNIFEFDDRTSGDVMTHRTDLCAINVNKPLVDVINLAIKEGFSRIPVYEDDIDSIVGIIYIKDMLKFTITEKNLADGSVRDYMHKVVFTPESARCRVLFKQFKETKRHMAVVVDEYGGTAGIVTMEDLLESIVGEIEDEYDNDTEIIEIEKIDDNTYLIDGGVEIEQISKIFSVKIEFDQHTETLGGLITNTLGYIPEKNQFSTIEIEGIEFRVLSVEDRRITRVKATKLSDEEINENVV